MVYTLPVQDKAEVPSQWTILLNGCVQSPRRNWPALSSALVYCPLREEGIFLLYMYVHIQRKTRMCMLNVCALALNLNGWLIKKSRTSFYVGKKSRETKSETKRRWKSVNVLRGKEMTFRFGSFMVEMIWSTQYIHSCEVVGNSAHIIYSVHHEIPVQWLIIICPFIV